MKILILEDEVIIAESLYQLLLLLDYDPLEPVSNPDDAIALIATEQPRLAILDIRLQDGRTGLEVAEYIRREKLDIPFIILTAHSDPDTVARVKRMKPAAYLVKPFTRESLFVAIEMATEDSAEGGDTAGEESTSESGELFIKTGTKLERINVKEIMVLRSQGKYTEMQFENSKRLVRMPLAGFINTYTQVPWLRAHKSYAVNPAFVTSMRADELELGKIKLPVGRFFQPDVEAYFTAFRAGHR